MAVVAKQKLIDVEHNGRHLAVSVKYREVSGKLLLFLHGWGAVKECFDQAFDVTELEGFSICAVDLVGFGHSEKDPDFSYDLQDQAKIVAHVIRILKPSEVYLVGHSMGGGVAVLCSQEMPPGMLRALITVEGNLVTKDASPFTRWIAAQPRRLFNRGEFGITKKLLYASPIGNHRMCAGWWDASDADAIRKSAQSIVSWSDSGKLLLMFSGLATKAYVYGEKSKRNKKVTLSKLAENEAYKVSSSGHFPMLDNPAVFYEIIAGIVISGKPEANGA